MRNYLVLLLFTFILFNTQAQISRMFFGSVGMSVLSDFHMTQSDLVEFTFFETQEKYYTSYQHFQWNYLSFDFGGRMNIANLGKSASLSLKTNPSIGLGLAYSQNETGSWYSATANIPCFIQFNYGVASRFAASQNFGFYISGGYEYIISPFYAYPVSSTFITYKEFTKKWMQPAAEIGLRFFNNKNRVNEINIKAGFGEEGKVFTKFDLKKEQEKKSFSLRVSFSKILNY